MVKTLRRKPNAAFMQPLYPSRELAAIVGKKARPRTELVMQLWRYIKSNKLQDPVKRRNINCDEKLRAVFGEATVSMFELAKGMQKQMSITQIEEKKMVKKMKFKVGDKVEVTRNTSGHGFSIGEIVEIYKVFSTNYQARTAKASWMFTDGECKLATKTQPNMAKTIAVDAYRKGLILGTAQKLMIPNNTITTLEIKTELRKTHPTYHWTQDFISTVMDSFASCKLFSFTDNGTFRTYSNSNQFISKAVKRVTRKTTSKKSPSPKKNYTSANTISRAKAWSLMANNKGHFFTATFIKTDGTKRVMNCQYLSGQTPDKTCVKVRESSLLKTGDNAIRQITLDRLKELKIAGNTWKIGKK